MKKYYFRWVAFGATEGTVTRLACGPIKTSLAEVQRWNWDGSRDPRDPRLNYVPRKGDLVTIEVLSPEAALQAAWASAAEWRRRQRESDILCGYDLYDPATCRRRVKEAEAIAAEAERTLKVSRVDAVPNEELLDYERSYTSHFGYSRGYLVRHDVACRCCGDSYDKATYAVVWQYEVGKHHHGVRTWKFVGAWVTPQADLVAVASAIVEKPQ